MAAMSTTPFTCLTSSMYMRTFFFLHEIYEVQGKEKELRSGAYCGVDSLLNLNCIFAYNMDMYAYVVV